MGSRYHLQTWLLFSFILASGQLEIPLDQGETYEYLEQNLASLFSAIDPLNYYLRFHCFITYTGTFDLRPSLEQRLMERFSVPIYSVGLRKGPRNHSYPKARNMVIILFSGLNDPTLAALNDTELSKGLPYFSFLYIPPRNVSGVLNKGEMLEFFSWCWERKFLRSMLFLRGESEVEVWSYFYFKNITMMKLSEAGALKSNLRKSGFSFYVQVANDLPSIFWYNSSEQANVIGGGNIRLSGPVGTMIEEFMRYLNVTMEILPLNESQSSNYEVFEVSSDRRVDMVGNLVANDSYQYSPVVMETQMCLVLPLRRMIPFSRYFHKTATPFVYLCIIVAAVCVFGVKYLAHHRRSLMEPLLSSLRFFIGIPLPGGQLDRLPLADKILEVYIFLFVGIMIGASVSILSTILTTGIYYPPITDVESMRASGLRIQTTDSTVKQVFEDNQRLRSLADLVDVTDEQIVYKNFITLNDNYAYVVPTHNWKGYRLYQQRLNNKRFAISGPELCSHARQLRLPISPYSPLRFYFSDYFYKVFESGLQRKWLEMGFQKIREARKILKLPVDEANNWKPLNLEFFSVFIKVYIGGMLLSTVVFILELLHKRYIKR